MGLFKRHILSSIFLVFYLACWIYFIYWTTSSSENHQYSCGAANAGVIMLIFLIIAIYSVTLTIKIIFAEGEVRSDYLKFLAVVLVPALFLFPRLL